MASLGPAVLLLACALTGRQASAAAAGGIDGGAGAGVGLGLGARKLQGEERDAMEKHFCRLKVHQGTLLCRMRAAGEADRQRRREQGVWNGSPATEQDMKAMYSEWCSVSRHKNSKLCQEFLQLQVVDDFCSKEENKNDNFCKRVEAARVAHAAGMGSPGSGLKLALNALPKNPFWWPLYRRLAFSLWRTLLRRLGLQRRVAVVRLAGAIAASDAGGSGGRLISLQSAGGALESAFRSQPQAVFIEINSPGGSPVQSSLLYHHIRDLKAKFPGVHCVAFVEDVAASGGYFIACAADEIICDASSIVGSVGVVRAEFGWVGAMKKLGVERRVLTAGENKVQLDPFAEEKPEDLHRARCLMNELHHEFISVVLEGRGDRLNFTLATEYAADLEAESRDDEVLADATAPKQSTTLPQRGLFDGSVYSGRRALELGLVDGIGELQQTARSRFGRGVELQRYGSKSPPLFGSVASALVGGLFQVMAMHGPKLGANAASQLLRPDCWTAWAHAPFLLMAPQSSIDPAASASGRRRSSSPASFPSDEKALPQFSFHL